MAHPKPTFGFTIPSLYDNTTLDCRIFLPNPSSSSPVSSRLSVPNQRSTTFDRIVWNGAIIAHPYAPLGGCYDDHVVAIVVSEFLKAGYAVGTFNFRGAPGSLGKTSWSGKSELEDFVSFSGFFMSFMHHLNNPSWLEDTKNAPTSPLSQAERPGSIVDYEIVLGGYSYGSLITSHLPPAEDILGRLSSPVEGSTAAEIMLRVRNLASRAIRDHLTPPPELKRASSDKERERERERLYHARTVVLGGEESSPESRRVSREGRRSSPDGHKHSFDIAKSLRSKSGSWRRISNHKTQNDHKQKATQEKPKQPEQPHIINGNSAGKLPMPNINYLLVSPLQPPVSTLLAPSFAQPFWRLNTRSSSQDETDHRDKTNGITTRPTLAVYGDNDMFTSVKKTRDWAQKMSDASSFASSPALSTSASAPAPAPASVSAFHYIEIAGAGHFWREDGVEAKLRVAIREWLRGFSGLSPSSNLTTR